MRRAFDERSSYDKPAFSAVELIDRWLAGKQHAAS